MGAQAFVLAAGFGTRLRPLTLHRCKPLVPVCGLPMLAYTLAACAAHGLRRAVVNAHYRAEDLAPWQGVREGVEVQLSMERPEILGTGGGLRAVRHQLAERVVVLNGDILQDVDLAALRQAVPARGAAMALRPAGAERYGVVAADTSGVVVRLVDVARAPAEGEVDVSTHFTGVHAMDRETLDLIPEGFACVVRSAYRDLVPARRVRALLHRGVWLDVGDPPAYLEANLALLEGRVRLALDPFARAAWAQRADGQRLGSGPPQPGPCWVGRDASLGSEVRLSRTVVGAGARIAAGTALRDCVVWEGVQVPAGRWERAIFYPGGRLQLPARSGARG